MYYNSTEMTVQWNFSIGYLSLIDLSSHQLLKNVMELKHLDNRYFLGTVLILCNKAFPHNKTVSKYVA